MSSTQTPILSAFELFLCDLLPITDQRALVNQELVLEQKFTCKVTLRCEVVTESNSM
jgi:hypothetical protein